MVALKYNGLLIVTVGLIASRKLGQMEFFLLSVVISHTDQSRGHIIYGSGLLCHHTYAGVHRHFGFHTRSHHRRFRSQKRHRLALHVRPHKSAVRIIVL